MVKNIKLEKPWIYEENFETPITLKPRYGYGLRFLELWFPKNMDLETVKYYVKYIGNYLAKHGISSYATIYKPSVFYRRVLFSLSYPKGVRGLNNIIIDIKSSDDSNIAEIIINNAHYKSSVINRESDDKYELLSASELLNELVLIKRERENYVQYSNFFNNM